MPSENCFACGSGLEVRSPGRADCSNRACPGGRAFSFCGFCKEYSFSLAKSHCFNPDCRMFNIKRTDCPICNRMSVISVHGRPLCINRECPSNKKTVTECFFCRNRSFLNSPGAMFCTKGDCTYLLQTVHKCFACGELSFDVSQNTCKNPDCQYFNVEMAACEKCKERAFVVEKGHSEFQRCINKDCELSKPGTAMRTVGEVKAKQLEGMLRDTLALPVDMIEDAARQAVTPSAGLEEPTPIAEVGQEPPVERIPPPEPIATLGVAEARKDVTPAAEVQPEPEPEPEPVLQQPVEEGIGELVVDEPELERLEEPEQVVTAPSGPGEDAGGDLDLLGGPSLSASLKDEEGLVDAGFEAEASARAIEPEPSAAKKSAFFGEGAQRRAPGIGLAPSKETSSISEVFEFVNEYILKDEKGQRYPLYLVIGLAGSGKTIYLTMLGDILFNKSTKYYFPYEGVDVKRTVVGRIFEKAGRSVKANTNLLEMLQERVPDLVYDFAIPLYEETIGKEQWSRATFVDEVYFLVAELTRHGKTIAKIVTIETSGESYEEIIRGIVRYKQAEKIENDLQKVLLEMMNRAQGFVVLVDPANDKNDSIYQNMFLVLEEEIEKRALNRLSSMISSKLEKYTKDVGSKMEQDDLRKAIVQMKKTHEAKERKKQELTSIKEKLVQRLKEFSERFEKEGLEMLIEEEEGEFIRKLEKIFANLSPEAAAAVQKRVKERQDDPKVLKSYYSGMIKQCLKNAGAIAQFQYDLRHKDAMSIAPAREYVERAMKEIYLECGIPESFRLELGEELTSDREVRQFQSLQYLAIAVTKSDMYPIIYPPEKYPEKKLPRSRQHIAKIENYLKLCGGEVRYYNTSATGYSVLKDTLFYPGKENTHTPINIVEPIFDMLQIT